MGDFWKTVFSPRNERSWGRVAATFALVNGAAWTWWLVLKIKTSSDFVHLPNLAIFIGAVLSLVGGIYGLSKGLDTIKAVKGAGDAANNPPAV